MAAAPQSAMRELDGLFLQILQAVTTEIMTTTSTAVGQVLKISEGFLSEQAQRAVTQFHSLYSSSSGSAAAATDNSKNVNDDVDRLIGNIQSEIAKGTDDATIHKGLTENAALKESRLRLSAIQKELETLIRLDSGIRDKLMPVLTSMQFEDMVRQRLQHLDWAWTSIIKGFDSNGILDTEMLGIEIDANLSSVGERNLFYKVVLKKEPPAGSDVEEGSLWF